MKSSTISDLGTRWSWVVILHGLAALPLGEKPPLPIREEVGWASEPVWSLPGVEFQQLIACHYTDWGIPARYSELLNSEQKVFHKLM